MTDNEILLQLQSGSLPFMAYLGGSLEAVSQASKSAMMSFHPKADLCLAGGSIQGGFLAAMLDAAMAHAVLAASALSMVPPTLELKVSYLKAATPGPHKAVGRVIRMGKSVGFLEGELFNGEGELIAKSSATARIVPRAPA